ncbi:hypothetical protein [Changchengzhania lutea]|uniref:hypothetical protein n=1 Tax=Changchengzhania lutea TaxID=2049305 RepID=UPI00115EBD6A|nr:hypothetical protein [Changchengzhania lutea]
MNQTDFIHILQNPQTITDAQTNAIKSVIDDFPYFQSARALYLKGLKNQGSLNYNNELKITASYTSDRSILFDFITSDAFVQNEISKFIKQNTEHLKDFDVAIEDISVNKSVTIDDALRQHINDTSGILDPALFQPKEERPNKLTPFSLDPSEIIETVTKDTKTQEPSEADVLQLGKPLQFDKREVHSFNEWLKLTRFKPIERPTEKIVKPSEEHISERSDKAKKFQLIEDFIAKNPKIEPRKAPITKGNLAKAQMIQPESLMTETLARIYVEQKNYKKAIQSYKVLSLKYPEKSSFFANQIKAVEQLQEQNNKE